MPSTHSKSIPASPRDSSIPVLKNPDPCSCLPLVLGPTEPSSVVEVSLPQGSTCGCRGACGQPKHSRHLCDRAAVVLGGQLCVQCTCSWLGCTSPRVWGKHCKFHKRKLSELSYTWQVVIAAGALNCELVPADALAFCDFYELDPAYKKVLRRNVQRVPFGSPSGPRSSNNQRANPPRSI